MVYHHPNAQPWGNTIPVLRLLLSDAASAQFARRVPALFASTAISCIGAATLVKIVPWSSVAPTVDRWVTPLSVLCGTGVLMLGNTFVVLRSRWWAHFQPQEESVLLSRAVSDSNFDRTATSSPDHNEPAADCEDDPSAGNGVQRAISTAQMALSTFLGFEFTAGLEASVTAWARIVCHGFGGFLGWHEPVSAVTRRRLYQVVLNTSLLSFTRTHSGVDSDLRVDVGGHVVIENARLPFRGETHRVFRKIVIFLDHESMQLQKVVCVHDRQSGGVMATDITTWGKRESDNTKDVSPAESLHQAGLILAALVMYCTHGSFHWLSTAVPALPAGSWREAAESTALSQWATQPEMQSSPDFVALQVHNIPPPSAHASIAESRASRRASRAASIAASPTASLAAGDFMPTRGPTVPGRPATIIDVFSTADVPRAEGRRAFRRSATPAMSPTTSLASPFSPRRSSVAFASVGGSDDENNDSDTMPQSPRGGSRQASVVFAVPQSPTESVPCSPRAARSGMGSRRPSVVFEQQVESVPASPIHKNARHTPHGAEGAFPATDGPAGAPPLAPATRRTSLATSAPGDDDVPGLGPEVTIKAADETGRIAEQPLFAVLQSRSTFYQISTAANRALRSHMSGDVTHMEVRGVIAATVQHSLEHYMLGELGPVFSDHAQCIVLKTDLSGMLHRRVYPVRHALRPSVACGNRPTDAVATVIYNACVERERELVQANAAAGAKPLFVPLKNFCAHYLRV